MRTSAAGLSHTNAKSNNSTTLRSRASRSVRLGEIGVRGGTPCGLARPQITPGWVSSAMTDGGFGGLCENGHDVPAGARYCPACGSPAYPPSAPQYPPDARPPATPPYSYAAPPYWAPTSPPPYGPRPPYPGPLPNYWAYGPPSRPTNGLAIASMVVAILWIYWIGSILGVVFGHVALRQIRRSGEGGRGMAIAGLVIGYVGIVFGVVVIAAIAATAPG